MKPGNQDHCRIDNWISRRKIFGHVFLMFKSLSDQGTEVDTNP